MLSRDVALSPYRSYISLVVRHGIVAWGTSEKKYASLSSAKEIYTSDLFSKLGILSVPSLFIVK